MRVHETILKKQIHGGAINLLKTSSQNLILTGAADKSLKCCDILRSLKVLSEM